MKTRTKRFALDCLALVEALPESRAGEVYGRQLIRCSSSVGANYRSACRAKSDADMVSKLSIVEEEADEAGYWLELLVDSGNLSGDLAGQALKESHEIVAMMVASRKTIRARISNGDSRLSNEGSDNRKSRIANRKSEAQL